MTTAIDAVIFDCDGVLVDSEVLAMRVSHRIVTDLGWQTDIETMNRLFIGCSGEFFKRTIEEHIGRDLEDGWMDPYAEWLPEEYRAHLRAIPGVTRAIDNLEAAGLPMAVASNSRLARVEMSLELTGMLERFAGKICSAEFEKQGKPAPDVYLSAARLLGVDPDRCLAIDDSPTGVTAAAEAGMHVLAFAGHFTADQFPVGERIRVISDMSEVPKIVACLRGE